MGNAMLRFLFVCGAIPLAAALFAACGQDQQVAKAPGSACAQSASDKSVCIVAPGEFPPPDCDPSAKKCAGPGTCAIDEKKCGSASTCLPLGNNGSRSILDLRIRRLNIAAPDALAALTVQQGIITRTVDLPNKECGEQGAGSFNWLLRIDKGKSILTTGGAPVSPDPFVQGFCFFDKKVGGTLVKPASNVPLTIRGSTINSATISKLVVPIFRSSGEAILLPLTDVTFRGVTISDDANCIGSFTPQALAADCSDDPRQCQKWKTAGAIAAFITLEEADAVDVPDLSESLCVLLTKTDKGPDGKCVRENGTIKAKGDFCSTSGKACDCSDSFWLAATFAASAVRINDGASVAECAGSGP
jgi:hypothetical protein